VRPGLLIIMGVRRFPTPPQAHALYDPMALVAVVVILVRGNGIVSVRMTENDRVVQKVIVQWSPSLIEGINENYISYHVALYQIIW